MNFYAAPRNAIFRWSYTYMAKPIFFSQDAEKMHKLFVGVGKILGSNPITRGLTSILFNYKNKILKQTIAGLTFPNPVGLPAGFDKNGELVRLMPKVGFGFAEVGSITAAPCLGNTGERLARLPSKQSLWVNLGLNNQGVNIISKRLLKTKTKFPLGVNIAKTNCKATTNPKVGLHDYLFSIKKVHSIADYIVLNISCPNAFGGQQFSDPKLFHSLLEGIKKLRVNTPIFVKISPDLTKPNIDKILAISDKFKVAGYICTNLTKEHDKEEGGLSGKSLEKKSNDLIRYVYKKTRGKKIIIGVGGVFSAEDAYKKIRLGASLIQVLTGMIFMGPQLISDINLGLVKLLKRDGLSHISDAVGADVKV